MGARQGARNAIAVVTATLILFGGQIATHWGLTAPFWFAGVGSAVTLAVLWRKLDLVVHADPAEPSDT